MSHVTPECLDTGKYEVNKDCSETMIFCVIVVQPLHISVFDVSNSGHLGLLKVTSEHAKETPTTYEYDINFNINTLYYRSQVTTL